MDWLIRGGTVIDGTGAPGRRADVALTGDRNTAVAPDLPADAAGRVVDATGWIGAFSSVTRFALTFAG